MNPISTEIINKAKEIIALSLLAELVFPLLHQIDIKTEKRITTKQTTTTLVVEIRGDKYKLISKSKSDGSTHHGMGNTFEYFSPLFIDALTRYGFIS